LLSRLHRRVEALDSACLRALGHPHDHAVRQELLSALEWEDSCDPAHARSAIRDTFKSVVEHSKELAHHLHPAAADPAAPVVPRIEKLRASLARMAHVLAARHETPPKD